VSNYTPSPLIACIRIFDDSPEDNEGGPIVYDVKLRVNGKYRSDIIPNTIMDDLKLERTTAMKKISDKGYIIPPAAVKGGRPTYDFLSIEGNIPKYADYLFYRDYIRGSGISKVKDSLDIELADKHFSFIDPGSGPFQVSGTKCIIYMFDLMSIKEHVNRVQAEITVANDYNIQTALIFTKETSGGHDIAGRNSSFYSASYWKTMAQANGNIKDKSNISTITLDFGWQVASLIYGLNFNFNYLGFQMNGEYVNNSSHFMYPDDYPGTGPPSDIVSGMAPRTGHKYTLNDNAYYITAQKDWNKLGFAAELFKMGKFYRPYMDYYYPFATSDPEFVTSAINSRNDTIRIPLIEDNDDNDQYPDTMIEQNTMGLNIMSSEDPDGVFPGNDADHDGIADNNKNNNGIPDYDERFLMFDSDNDNFVFGNDFNNNIPDFREDDMKFDLPYDLDRQGHHILLRYTLAKSVNLIVGSLRTGGIGYDNRTNDDYVKLLVNYNFYSIGSLYAEYRHERIQDDIRDPYIQVSTNMKETYVDIGKDASTGRFTRELYYDELEYKNSRVNRLWINSLIKCIPSITLENHVKIEQNQQIKGEMYDKTYQPADNINTFAMINKIVYTKRLGNWVFSPGIKFRFYKKDRNEIARPGDYNVTRIPLIMIKYEISPRTDIQLGLQGLSGFEFDYKDYVQRENNFKHKTYMLQLQNRTTYFGYDIWASTGVEIDQTDYAEATRQFENYKSSVMYVKVFLGW
jgi:hypothetical protein